MDGRPSAMSGGQNPAYRPTARKGPPGPFFSTSYWPCRSCARGRLPGAARLPAQCHAVPRSGGLAEHPGDLRAAHRAGSLGGRPAVGQVLLLAFELALGPAFDAVALITRQVWLLSDALGGRSASRFAGSGFPRLAYGTFFPALFPSGLW